MSFDDTDFIDREFQASSQRSVVGSQARTALDRTQPLSPATAPMQRPPTREELESKVSDAHAKLAELKRAQEELERERAALEESRRRRSEFQQGREEMLQHLTRGIVTLEEQEMAARQDAEQISKTLAGLREAFEKVQSIQEDQWSAEVYTRELTRGLTVVDNARMEWNTARIKWPRLNGSSETPAPQLGSSTSRTSTQAGSPWWRSAHFMELTKLGLAFTWPLLVAGTGIIITLLVLLARR